MLLNYLSYKQLDIAAERINEVKHSSPEKRQIWKNVNREDKVNKPKLCLIILWGPENRKTREKAIFNKVIINNILDFLEDNPLQIWEIPRITGKINTRKSTVRHAMIK